MPTEPPEADESAQGEPRQQPQSQRIGVQAVHTKHAIHIIGDQGTGRGEQHREEHKHIADGRLERTKYPQAGETLVVVPLSLDEQQEQQGNQHGINTQPARCEPFQRPSVGEKVDSHQHHPGGKGNALPIHPFEVHINGTAQVGKETQHKDNRHQQHDDNQVVHMLPLVIIGKLGGQGDGHLSSGKRQRIEPGIELAAHLLAAEERLNHHHHLKHHKGFQEPDEEAAHNDDIHILRIAAGETQQGLHYQVEQQHGLRCGGIPYLADHGISHCQSCRSGVISHCHIFAQHSQRIGNIHSAARVGSVHQQHRQQYDEYRHDAEPLWNPSTGRQIKYQLVHSVTSSMLPFPPSYRPARFPSPRPKRRQCGCARGCAAAP